MIFRYFMHKRTVAHNKLVCGLNKEFLNSAKDFVSKEDLFEMKKEFDLHEARLKENEVKIGKLCDVLDLQIYIFIAQLILNIKGFDIGLIITQFMAVIIMAYAFFVTDNKAKYLYIPTIAFILMSALYNIYSL